MFIRNPKMLPAKVVKLTNTQIELGCINHTCALLSSAGYGLVFPHNDNRYVIPAHKLVYCQSIGIDVSELPRGKIQHTCKNIRCINPAHMLFTEYKVKIAEESISVAK